MTFVEQMIKWNQLFVKNNKKILIKETLLFQNLLFTWELL